MDGRVPDLRLHGDGGAKAVVIQELISGRNHDKLANAFSLLTTLE
jgi:hypothetical protein